MANNIDLNQIAIVLSQLVHNYNVLAQNWFKVFYDSTPDGNIQLTFFDEEGNLKSYTTCNRAYDRNFRIQGEGEPEGNVSAPIGTIYQDTKNGAIYFKATQEENDVTPHGWQQLQPLDNYHSFGSGEPSETAEIGHLYTDTQTGYLYMNTLNGWQQVGATGFATEEWVEERIKGMEQEIQGGVVHITGDETIGGVVDPETGAVQSAKKTFADNVTFKKKTTFGDSATFGNIATFNKKTTFDDIATFKKVIMGTAYRALSADIAEFYEADEYLEPGTLVQFGGEKEITKATDVVNAIVSTNPAYILNDNKDMKFPTLIALSGRIPVRVEGPVHKFDKIILSGNNGVAVAVDKNTDVCYNVIGRALEENLEEGEKLVECVVKLEL